LRASPIFGSPGKQRPVIIAEPWPDKRLRGKRKEQQLIEELRQGVGLIPDSLPDAL